MVWRTEFGPEVVAAYGREVSETKIGGGTAIQFRLGAADGEFSVVVEDAWRIEVGDQAVLGSETELFEMRSRVSGLLNGRVLQNLVVDDQSMDARFEFNDGTVLRTFSTHRMWGDDHWWLLLPGNQALSASPGRRVRLGPADSVEASQNA